TSHVSPDELLYRAQLRLCSFADLDAETWLAAFDSLAHARAQVGLSEEVIHFDEGNEELPKGA
ncbi:MAG: hypothetical protein ACREBG_03480, partial [Pyrinomonadaceae bacterium]